MPALLVVIGGLPASGKSTLAVEVARRRRCTYLRLDRIEQAIVDASGPDHPVGTAGYLAAYALAAEQLSLGLDVVAECVNPLAATRDSWVSTAAENGAELVEVEVICSDVAEHRHRVATRPSDVPGLRKPDWSAVTDRPYEPWTRDHLVVDTAGTSVEAAVELIMERVAALR